MIRYRLASADHLSHEFEVQVRLTDAKDGQCFSLPSWIPGSYLLREYAKHVVSIDATNGKEPVALEKIDKSTWRCAGAHPEINVTARIYALDLSVRGAYLDSRRAYFNGTCLALCPLGREREPIELTIEDGVVPPDQQWRVATAMRPVTVDERGFGTYAAEDYDELVDHPVEISDFAEIRFAASAIIHRLVIAGRHKTDLERVADDLRRLCETHIAFFGEPAPFDSYLFLGLAVGEGYGGLEHRASSSLIFNRDDLPKPGESKVPKDYERFLSLCSHEYFHTWNIKRIKPAAFTPYRLDRRNHTRLLWVFEGITSYYQDLMLLRSDLITVEAYLERLGRLLTRVYRTPGRRRQSIAESSFDAWDKLYKPDANSPNSGVSYYSKGAMVALALDLTLRRAAPSSSGLDGVMAKLWARYGRGGDGVPEDGFERLAGEVLGSDLGQFFDAAVRGNEDPPLEELLGAFGVSLQRRASSGPEDKGGSKAQDAEEAPLSLGINYRLAQGGLELIHVMADGPAQRAGLNPGDRLIALGGLQVDEKNLSQRLKRLEPGELVAVTVFRGDELLEFPLTVDAAPADTCFLTLMEQADPDMSARRKSWLGS